MSEDMQVDQAVIESKPEEAPKEDVPKETVKEDSTATSTTSIAAVEEPTVGEAAATTPTAAAGGVGDPAKGDAAKDAAPPGTKRMKNDVDMASLSTRQYLDTTVVPILLQALSALAKERPTSPIEFVANYLLKYKANFEGGQPAPTAEK